MFGFVAYQVLQQLTRGKIVNFIQNGLDWFQAQRKAHTTFTVKVGTGTIDQAVEMQASKVKSKADSTRNGVKMNNEYHVFIFDKAELDEEEIVLNRNLKIWFQGDTYIYSQEGRKGREYNDPLNKDVIVPTVLIDDQ